MSYLYFFIQKNLFTAGLGVCAYCAPIVQFALRIKAYFLGLRNLRCAFTKQFAFSQFAL